MALTDDRGVLAGGYEKQPPQDLAAEQSVLGGMMLSKDAIADVVEVLSPDDFYRPAHQAVYDCVLDLYARGEPADPITVSAELERRGELGRVGGAPYLHTLIATVPTAANAGYYAEIVAEKAVLRRLVEAGTRIVQMGYHGAEGAEIDEVVDRAQAAIYEVTERRMSEDYVSLEELLQPTMDEIDAIASRGGSSLGVPTGFADLDELTNGLHPGQMIIVAARPGVGKALALDTVLPTPEGWTTMGTVAVGDALIGSDGRPTTVVAATDVMRGRPCYEVEFSDGTVIVADADHQWSVRPSPVSARTGVKPQPDGPDPDGDLPGVIRTTAEIAATMANSLDLRPQWVVQHARALELPACPRPGSPYALGVWLSGRPRPRAGGGGDAEIEWNLAAEGVDIDLDEVGIESCPADAVSRSLEPVLEPPPPRERGSQRLRREARRLGALDGQHIPTAYLRGSADQRSAVLAGLLDSAGTIATNGSIRLRVASEELARDVRELIVSLGYSCSLRRRRSRSAGGAVRIRRTLVMHTEDDVFRLERKRLRHKRRRTRTPRVRSIVAVRRVPSVPVRCVEVSAPDHLYLASHAMIATHNSTLGLDFARSCSVKHGMTSVIFSLEMSRTEIVMRMLSAEARIRLQDMRGGRMSDDDWTRLARRMSEISEAPMFIDDSPNMTMMEIRAKARRLKQRNDLKLIVVDYMQLMTSGKRVESRQQEVSEFSRQLKLLAKELELPVVAISQLNRGPEQRTDKRPMLADLRESGSLEQDADMVLLIHRPDAWERDDPRAGEADLIIAKHRSGPTTTITVAHQLHYSRFADLAQG